MYYAFPQYGSKVIAYFNSPNRQSKRPFHHEFISDFHMNYDVGPR